MITGGFSFIAFIVCLAAGVFFVEEKTRLKFFEYVPPLVIIYFSAMLLSTFGMWTLSDNGVATGAGIARSAIRSAILPSMIFLMLLKCDMRNIMKLGPKMLLAFFSASFSIMIAFIVAFDVFHENLASNSWQTFGALAGSWIGGTQNMVAVQQALGLNDAGMGYTLLIDSIDYSIWIMLLLMMVSTKNIARRFNRFNRADTSVVEEISAKLAELEKGGRTETTFLDLFGLLALALGSGAFFTFIADYLPQSEFITSTIWMIMLATVAGILCAMTPLSRVPGSKQLSNIMLYTMVALIASSANFAELTEAPVYIIAGFLILAIHAVVMLLLAKLFKIDLFTCCIASCSNIGGVASSPIIAGAYNENLVPIGVLMGMLGAIIGTGGGLLVARILFTMI